MILAPLAAILLFLVLRRSLADMTPGPTPARACSYAPLLLGCIVLALAGVRWLWHGDALGVVFVVDDSASISPEARIAARRFIETSLQHRRRDDESGVLGFARKTVVWQPPAASNQLAARFPDTPAAERTATDIGGALAFAASVLPPDRSRRVVLLTDGNDTTDAGAETAARLGGSGVQVDTVPLRNPTTPEVLVASVDLPGGLHSGEPFDLRTDIESNVATTTKVNLYQNQFLAGQQDLTLKPGRNDVTFRTCARATVLLLTRWKSSPPPTPGWKTTAPGPPPRSGAVHTSCSSRATKRRPRRSPGPCARRRSTWKRAAPPGCRAR